MRQKKTNLSFITYLIIIIVLGYIYIVYTWINSNKVTEGNALNLARTAEASFQLEVVSKLRANPEDIYKIEYATVKNSLTKITEINRKIRFAYLYTVKEGKVYFMADSEPVSSKDFSPPGQLYEEADENIHRAFESNEPIISKSSSDRWGTWISILVPMKNNNTGKTIAVLGIDYPKESWSKEAIKQTLISVVILLFSILLFIMIYVIHKNNKSLKEDRNRLTEINEVVSEQEELFRTLFEQSPLGISFGNYNNNSLDANPMLEKIIGRPKEELSNLDWRMFTHPEDVNKDMELFKQFKNGDIDGYSLKKRYIRPDTSIVWVNITIARLNISIKNVTHICIAEDITDQIRTEISLKASERSNAMLLSNLPGMAYRCSYDQHWTMVFVSDGCYELTGYRPEDFIDNQVISFDEVIHPDYRETIRIRWNQALKEKTILKEEYYIIGKDQQQKWILEHGQGVYDEHGEVIGVEGLILDMSERKKKEDEILYLNYHDAFTGLYNRRYFDKAKEQFDTEDKYPLSVIIGDINGLKVINSALGHAEGDKLILQIAKILKDCLRNGDILARSGGDEFSILLPNTSYEEADRVVNQIGRFCEEYKKNILDEAYHVSISVGCATKKVRDVSLTSIIKEAEESMYRHKLLQSKSLHSSIISSMKTTLFEKSQETEEHAQRLITLSKAIGQQLNLVEGQLNELELLSTLHDIGKIGISDNILNKPGKLNDEEWLEMKKHPEMGYRIAMSTPELAPIAEYILYHHERWDGQGYPGGKRGEDIPLLSRIIAIADSYDAMTSDRPYRKAMTQEDAFEEIRKNAGSQFDPYLCELFNKINLN